MVVFPWNLRTNKNAELGFCYQAFTEFSVFALLFGTLVYSWITQGQTMGQGLHFLSLSFGMSTSPGFRESVRA